MWLGFRYLQDPLPQSPFKNATIPESQPNLQANPVQDLKALDQAMSERLHSVGWVVRENGVVHMPIDRAMTLLEERGLAEETQ
jgi:hypothetical protein